MSNLNKDDFNFENLEKEDKNRKVSEKFTIGVSGQPTFYNIRDSFNRNIVFHGWLIGYVEEIINGDSVRKKERKKESFTNT